MDDPYVVAVVNGGALVGNVTGSFCFSFLEGRSES